MQVTIRPLKREDALISYKWRNNADIWRYTGSHPDTIITPEIETKWIDTVLKQPNEKRFAILVDDIYIGNTYITHITPDDGIFHIFIGEQSYWGKGIGKQALLSVMKYAKYTLKLKELFLKVNPDNTGAIHMYEKCGFTCLPFTDENKWLLMRRVLNDIQAPAI